MYGHRKVKKGISLEHQLIFLLSFALGYNQDFKRVCWEWKTTISFKYGVPAMAELFVWTLTKLLGLNPSSGATRCTKLFSLAETSPDKLFLPKQVCWSLKVRGTNGTLSWVPCPFGYSFQLLLYLFLKFPGSEKEGGTVL